MSINQHRAAGSGGGGGEWCFEVLAGTARRLPDLVAARTTKVKVQYESQSLSSYVTQCLNVW